MSMYKFKLGEKVFAFNKDIIYEVITITLTKDTIKHRVTYTLYEKSTNQMLENVPEHYIRHTRKLEDLSKPELIDFINFYHNYNDKNSIQDINLFLNKEWLEYNTKDDDKLIDEEWDLIKDNMNQ